MIVLGVFRFLATFLISNPVFSGKLIQHGDLYAEKVQVTKISENSIKKRSNFAVNLSEIISQQKFVGCC